MAMVHHEHILFYHGQGAATRIPTLNLFWILFLILLLLLILILNDEVLYEGHLFTYSKTVGMMNNANLILDTPILSKQGTSKDTATNLNPT